MYIYYVYAYLRSKDSETAKTGTPYYIGKGKGSRKSDGHKYVPVPKDKSLIVILEENLSEIGAFALERRMIQWYGRKDLGTGILLNRADGGEGASGYKHTDAAKANISKGQKNKIITDEFRQKISDLRKGIVFTDEHKQNLSISHIGNEPSNKGQVGIQVAWNKGMKMLPHSEETKRKRAESVRLAWARRKESTLPK